MIPVTIYNTLNDELDKFLENYSVLFPLMHLYKEKEILSKNRKAILLDNLESTLKRVLEFIDKSNEPKEEKYYFVRMVLNFLYFNKYSRIGGSDMERAR